ncbi:uncharacterized, partial [Tachysurus ichikawai]
LKRLPELNTAALTFSTDLYRLMAHFQHIIELHLTRSGVAHRKRAPANELLNVLKKKK